MKKQNQVRIIGGKWRQRKITFPDIPGLRPTHDRMRETLFNWLMPNIVDATCLDLFAGSGAIGFEAASRGAKSVVMCDQDPQVIAYLLKNKEVLQADNIIIQKGTIPEIHISNVAFFDIVFLDPPFHQNLITVAVAWLIQKNLVKSHSLVYVEMENSIQDLIFPQNWHIIKNTHTASVQYFLMEVT
jgi:16S rRNA (guanine966-N2)-methyltransferase